MSDTTPLPLSQGAYERTYGREPEIECFNRFFEENPTNMVDFVSLLSRPATSRYAAAGAGPLRGTFTQDGTFAGALFVVSNETLFYFDKDNTRTEVTGFVGNSPSTPVFGGVEDRLYISTGEALLMLNEDGARATGILRIDTSTGVVTDGDTVTLQGIVYTFKNTMAAAYDVQIGTTLDETLQNLADAVNAQPETIGINYALNTEINPFVNATFPQVELTDTILTFYATIGGTTGNAYTTTETGADLSFDAATLSGGAADTLNGIPTPDDVGIVSIAVLDGFVFCVAAQSQRVYFIRPGKFLIDPLDVFEAESIPDEIIQAMTVGDQVWFFGSQSTDAYYLADNSDFPIARYQGRSFSKGALEGTVVLLNDQVILVGNDNVVYAVAGGQQRISNHGIEERIRLARKDERAAP